MGGNMQNDLDLFKKGRLSDAILSATDNVKSNQSDIVLRSRLVEYLCLSSQFDRADRQLEAIASLDPKTTIRVMELRQLIRASQARGEMWTSGRLPEFTTTPPEHIDCRLRALVCFREGNHAEGADLLLKAEECRPSLSGQMGDTKFDEFRDLDDFYGGVLEVMTSTGKYFWVPMEHIIEANFTSPTRPIDAAWCEVDLTLREGPSGVVYVPAIYPQINGNSNSEALIVGRETEWIESSSGIIRGQGLRSFIIGEQSLSIHELNNLQFE
jgi:type VI secretion system protein ImpE